MAIIAAKHAHNRFNQSGFTLIEIVGVLVIISVLATTTITRYDLLSDTAGRNLLTAGIRELNIRESLVWAEFKISDTGWPGDDAVFAALDKDLGPAYSWNPAVTKDGGFLYLRSVSVQLQRTHSNLGSPGSWKRI
jgi:prepilin-type N-terminal cleavage/methylation domain-containing protein